MSNRVFVMRHQWPSCFIWLPHNFRLEWAEHKRQELELEETKWPAAPVNRPA
jgi:hypothetical protein